MRVAANVGNRSVRSEPGRGYYRVAMVGPRFSFSQRRAFDKCGQATKGVWGMSWHQEAMKGVEDCEKSGGAVKQAIIPEFPNWHVLNP